MSEETSSRSMVLNAAEFIELTREYDVWMRHHLVPPLTVERYAAVSGKNSGELIGYMWFNQMTDEWLLFGPEDATEEILEVFAA